MLHPRDEQGAAAPAAPLRRAATALSHGADAAKYGTGQAVDLDAVDAEISRVIGFLIQQRRAELVRALAVRVTRSHGSMSKWLCGESGDVLQLLQELASIRSAVAVLKLADQRVEAVSTRGEAHAHPVADRVQ
jgi:hypothetical protein